MQPSGGFLKTTAMGGFFVLLPLLLFFLLVGEILDLIVGLATPIADLMFPAGTFDEINFPVIVAVVLFSVVSFAIGLTLRSDLGSRFGRWIERNTVGRLPLYRAVKEMAGGFAGGGSFRPALLSNSDTEREIVYLIEDHGNGQATILVPWAPASFAGSVKIVSGERIEMLDANLGDVSRVLSHWGVGARRLMEKQE
jgi:uncharacterized membrane protein